MFTFPSREKSGHHFFQTLDLIPELRCALKLKVLGSIAHLKLQLLEHVLTLVRCQIANYGFGNLRRLFPIAPRITRCLDVGD